MGFERIGVMAKLGRCTHHIIGRAARCGGRFIDILDAGADIIGTLRGSLGALGDLTRRGFPVSPSPSRTQAI